MFVVPLYIFLLIYFVLLAGLAVFYLIFIYHIVGTASVTVVSISVSFLVLAMSLVTIFIALGMLSGVDWSLPAIQINLSNWVNL